VYPGGFVKVKVDVDVFENGDTTTDVNAAPLHCTNRVSPGYIMYVASPSISSELFGSSVISPVPELRI
jgi:hypothetical protein